MKNWKKLAVFGLALLAFGGVFAGCGNKDKKTENKTAESQKNQTDHLNIATQPAPGYLPLTILQDKGWLEEALKEAGYDKVKVTFTEFESGPPENESFASGQQDVGVMGNVPSIGGLAAGQKRTFLGISTNGEKTEAVLVPPNSDIKKIEDLKGKKIGLVVGSITQNLLYVLLDSVGLKLSDVELVNLGIAEQQEALANGQVDAVATWQPMIAQLESSGTGKILADGTGLFLAENTVFSQDDYLAENPEIVKIFIQQYARAAKELTGNIDAYATQYADKYGLEADLLKKTLESANFPILITEADVKDLQGTADFLYGEKLVKQQVTIADHVDYSFSEDEKVLEYLK